MQKSKILAFLLALVVSIVLWFYAVTVVNPDDTITISGISVQFEGTEALTSQGLMLTGGDSTKVSIKVSGRRSDLKELNNEMLLDISLPRYSGYHWCAEIRKVSKVPVMFISSASDNMNIVMAMNMGADDFIAKPFDLEVLMAKVQALLRRAYDFAGTGKVLECGGAVLDIPGGALVYGEG